MMIAEHMNETPETAATKKKNNNHTTFTTYVISRHFKLKKQKQILYKSNKI